ncbi:MAG: 3-hydroxyacyl-CoA dehydrogenase NAD-binding domain-containing protein [Bacteroidales bacterium]|jgi:3-hydroxybutyryl-CoA dehydrogenase|nr:3-hydroxyacyl-CoA dehydrogenase NAD-binding domain-containing protein [Bacteroidales bacterium]MDD2569863.1 3-hydroxyacyl-CoA dehydrogenase NAD-binding domain-containing protein [Bacteroidales bacterium]MDD2811791.1 3-hydroxyacyl-CoA dehydrogenase NAD-binding domain-containing protein [Bacteroidales bacterium]MDD3384702.1 3-hydroxyacyl-CoA dehydrogenase NAD-binding domain-containing protein [Bacteroidales bacterium]MDD3810951.1 3-hydroxyacyl-CoA dehydrogenase NAD-binding domain-containing pr
MADIIEPIEPYALSKKNKPKTLFSKVGIVGCGSVGQSIARMIATKGIDVVFIELDEEKIESAKKGIESELDYMINHWGMTQGEKRGVMNRIKGSLSCKDLQGCDLVIEAIKSRIREERISLRKEIFKHIEEYVDPTTIIATNSTTIVTTELSTGLKHNDRCVSLHFSTSNPGANIVEVARGLYTSDETYENVKKFVSLIGKKMIPVQESPGLITVRLFSSLINEACEMYMEGVGAMEDIDISVRTGLGLGMGPFELADKIGLDKVVRWLENLYNEFGDLKYKANPLLKRLVRANRLGRITGQGFFQYDENGKRIENTTI